MERHVASVEDVLALMDTLFDEGADRWSTGAGADWWDAFYDDRERGVPFFRDAPDESLVAWHGPACWRPEDASWTWGADPAGTPSGWPGGGTPSTPSTCPRRP